MQGKIAQPNLYVNATGFGRTKSGVQSESEGGEFPRCVSEGSVVWRSGERTIINTHRYVVDPKLPDGYSRIFRSYVFGPSGFWTMAPLRCAAKFDPFLSLDCAPTPSTLAQAKERKGSNFAIWQPCTLSPAACTKPHMPYSV